MCVCVREIERVSVYLCAFGGDCRSEKGRRVQLAYPTLPSARTVTYCIVLHSTVLYCMVLTAWRNVLYCSALYLDMSLESTAYSSVSSSS